MSNPIEVGKLRVDRLIHTGSLQLDTEDRGRRKLHALDANHTLRGTLARILLVGAGLGLAGSASLPVIHVLTGHGEHFKNTHNPNMNLREKLELRIKLALPPTQSP